jgi:hypothetical protein
MKHRIAILKTEGIAGNLHVRKVGHEPLRDNGYRGAPNGRGALIDGERSQLVEE